MGVQHSHLAWSGLVSLMSYYREGTCKDVTTRKRMQFLGILTYVSSHHPLFPSMFLCHPPMECPHSTLEARCAQFRLEAVSCPSISRLGGVPLWSVLGLGMVAQTGDLLLLQAQSETTGPGGEASWTEL